MNYKSQLTMKNSVFIIFLLTTINLFSQKTPTVTLNDSSQLKLTNLKVDVEIIGNFATTTYDMKFYNELDRTLEGELIFPLGEGQSVSKFSMDVNGKLREAVVVEKELARVAFESTVRQNIDPGLLEKTQGNNYKARVYPILAKAYKHIVVTYEQELFTMNKSQLFELPLGIKDKLKEFSINISVYGGESMPKIKNNPYKQLVFKENAIGYCAELAKVNHVPSLPIVVQIPTSSDQNKVISFQDYFYAYKTLTPNTRLKDKPRKITILWDASYSLKNRNVEEELKLLKNYIAYLHEVEVQYISFSNTIHQNKTLSVNEENWVELEQLVRSTTYDGGTSLNLFKGLKIKADETLLFTDGLANLGSFASFNKEAVYTINSTVSANHEVLNNIATQSGGNYLNLVRLSYEEAFNVLKQETYQFLGVNHSNAIEEVYPFKNTNVTSDFSITGKFSEETTMELLFGYRGKVTKRIHVPVKRSDESKLVKRLWAKQKLKYLNEDKNQNKPAIIELAKHYHLVTDFTSMLILDRIEDYVRYRIEPPQELKQEYKELLTDLEENEASRKEELVDRKEELVDDYEDIMDWYKTNYPIKRKQKEKKIETENEGQTNNTINNQSTATTNTETNTSNVSQQERVETAGLDSTKRIISGTVVDESGPLPGVSVLIKGTTDGTETDFDGNFFINAEENDQLQFSYIGMNTKYVTVGNSNTIAVTLDGDALLLEEVVVTALGVSTERRSISASVTSAISQSLAGKISGVNVTGQPGASSSVSIRGVSSISSNSQPLYIIDGVPITGNSATVLKPDDIEAMQMLNGVSATKIYGARASNGIIIITTKNGKEANQEAIDDLNRQISEKIELKSWNPDTPYINILEKELTVEEAYNKYLEIRDNYSNSPSFFIDVADFFDKKECPQIAITILTNLIEVELDNYELMKALAYKLEYFEKYDLAVIVYEKVLELRPEEPQSYRDLALAYEQNGEIQKCFNLLHTIYNGDLLHKDVDERFYGIEHVAYVELSRLVSKCDKKLKLTKNQKLKFKEMPVDVRVVIDWNHNDTDIDLWVTDPSGEKAFYSNSETKMGGRMSEDIVDGYGPEEFMLKNATKGDYKVMVDYYSDNVQKISGPTMLKATFYTNYGRKNEDKKTVIFRLDKEEDEIEIGSVKFGYYD